MAKRSMKGETKGLVLHNPALESKPRAFRAYYHVFISNAIARNIEVTMTPNQIEKLASQPCYYCGLPPQPRKFGKHVLAVSGIDRRDSSKSYTPHNTVSACKPCNRIKYVMTVDEFLEYARRIVAKHS